jgi:glutathione S-transferase
MKFFSSFGPNPRVVRIFMAEKGLSIPIEAVDIVGGENRQAAHMKRNPMGQMPALELDNGEYLSEVTAICEYLEDKNPKPALIGETAEQKAECRMWTRRIDLNICEPLVGGYRSSEGLDFFKSRIITAPEMASGFKKIAADRVKWLNDQIESKQFICGSRFSLADILLFCFIDFGNKFGQPLDPANASIASWFSRVKSRPTSKA